MKIGAFVFDMDGLLLDSERIAFACGQQACENLGVPWRTEVALAMIGRNARDNAALMLSEYGADFPIARHQTEFARLYAAAIDAGEIPLKPGVTTLLDRLDELELPRAVATSTARERAEHKLARVGILDRFDLIVGGDEVQRGKPAPDIFLAAAARLDVAPARCLALEDSNAGIRAALAAGMQVRMIPDLLQPEPDVLAAGVPILASLADVLEILE
ncbi:HAD family phosphatase [Niveibacterium sp. SC-1]|uniref:HAD family hydrolase n=1 Tax=Niveibacterium sp. SC-1 TaxID=3135646 RepID=UPI00311DA1D5